MEHILTELENILEALSRPAKLEGDELSSLNNKWVRTITRLKEVLAKKQQTLKKDAPRIRQRLEKILVRMPEIQSLLNKHKSEIAEQLFMENRRVQAVRQGAYGSPKKRQQLLRQRA
jgi:DNA repair ATPase RecN